MAALNCEILILTYGSIVRQLIADTDNVDEVNKQLEKMGFNMGQRLIDEFLAKTKITKCSEYREIAERIGRIGFKMFLGVNATVSDWSSDGSECSLTLESNPLAEYVEIPENLKGLRYSNIIPGAIRGALEAVNVDANCDLAKDAAAGDDSTVLRLKFIAAKPEEYPFKDDD